MSLRVESFGCFGKRPVSREFLVDSARELADSGFDRWVGEGLGLAKAFSGPRFDGLVSGFPAWHFAWNAGGGRRFLAGRLVPGEDAAGRKHPFALFAWLDGRGAVAQGSSLPLLLRELSGRLDDLSGRVDRSATPAELLDAVRGEAAAMALDDAGARRAAEQYWRDQSSAPFWTDILGRPDDPARYQVMQAFEESVAPLRGRDPAAARYGIRFPLPAGAPEAGAAFWLELTARRIGRGLDRACWFWSRQPAAEPAAADLLLFFSEPAATQWTGLVDREAELESISVLTRPYGGAPESRMGPALKGLLDTPGARLDEYLAWARNG